MARFAVCGGSVGSGAGVLAALLACAVPAVPGDTDTEGDSGDETGGSDDPWCHADRDEVDARVDALLADLSLADKVELVAGSSPLIPAGGVFKTKGVPSADLPGLSMVDGPRGVSQGTGNATAFPVGSARGATWDPALERRVGEVIAREARSKGASVLLAPTINVLRHPRWGRSQETYGEDPLHVGIMGAAFIEGVQSQNVIASAKHLAANSIEDTRFEVNVSVAEKPLREIYLPAFRRAVVEAGVGSVMSAYNKVNGLYCGENPQLLREILKDEWGFPGFVESDWLFGTRSTAASMTAGLDIEMPTPMFYAAANLLDAIEAGEIDPADLDDAVARIARTQWCFEIDTDPPVVDATVAEAPDHVALAREVAERAITLLKNPAGALPLDRSSVGTVAVVGPLADVANMGDRGSSDVDPSNAVTPMQGLEAGSGSADVRRFDWPLPPADEAAFDAAGAVVIVAGLTEDQEGEGLIAAGDRDTMSLPAEQEQLIAEVAARHPNVVVVLEGGSSIIVEPWIQDVEALVMAWYPGMEGGHAIASVLFGDVDPGGRTPVVWPIAESDLPEFDNVSTEVTYDGEFGYRHLDAQDVSPRYEFGFGMSYTRFEIGQPVVEETTVSFDGLVSLSVPVTNIGLRAGRAVVQIYEHQPGLETWTLAGFASVDLDTGASAVAEVSIPVRELAEWDGAWTVAPGVHRFYARAHDNDATGLSVDVTVE
jgi:beta-glucosidase